jgi:protoheme IX farnesyltransferase
MGSLRNYLKLMQFKIVALLVLSSVGGFFVAYKGSMRHPLMDIALIILGITASASGAELMNKVLERDIDGKMERTKNRLTVRRMINANYGMAYGITLTALGIAAGYIVNPLTALMIVLGVVFYIIVYTKVLKRRSRFSVVIGGLAGSFCVWAGVTAAANSITFSGLLLGLLVLFWIPGHIWSFAIKYKDDYNKAGVPMLTAVVSPRTGTAVIAFFNIFMALLSAYLALDFGAYYAAVIAIPLALIFYLSFRTFLCRAWAWPLFKFSSVYLMFVFIAVIIARLV